MTQRKNGKDDNETKQLQDRQGKSVSRRRRGGEGEW